MIGWGLVQLQAQKATNAHEWAVRHATARVEAFEYPTGAVVAVTVQGADEGDTTTSIETLIEAADR